MWTDVNGDTLSITEDVLFGGDSLYLQVTDEFGCFNSQLFIIPSTPLPVANFTANPASTYIQLPEATISYADNTQISGGRYTILKLFNPAMGWQLGTWEMIRFGDLRTIRWIHYSHLS
ncbi:MAG: hypothetical protein R2850_09810 [Bacteroidia bacterium]